MTQPTLSQGLVVGDLLPLSREELAAQSRRIAETAVSLPEYSWDAEGEMPVLKWDRAFDRWLDRRITQKAGIESQGYCLLPWVIFENLPARRKKSDILCWNQGSVPSCSFTAAAHATQFATLKEIALGAPLEYHAINPIVAFWLSKGKSLWGGQSLDVLARWLNEEGQYPETAVGPDNLRVPRRWEEGTPWAKRFQLGVCYIEETQIDEIVEKIFRACAANCDVVFGSMQIYTSARRDRNGIKTPAGSTSGGHAQMFGGFRSVGTTDYVWLQNSHGDIYGTDEEGSPGSGLWCDEESVREVVRTMPQFGCPFIVFPEGPVADAESRFTIDFPTPFPKNWVS